MSLERVEVAQRRRLEDRRTEPHIFGLEDGVVIFVARHEPVEQVAQGVDPQPASDVIVEGRDRTAMERRIVLEGGPDSDRAPAGNIKVQPARWSLRLLKARCQSPGGTRWSIRQPNMRDLHGGESIRVMTGSATMSPWLDCRPR